MNCNTVPRERRIIGSAGTGCYDAASGMTIGATLLLLAAVSVLAPEVGQSAQPLGGTSWRLVKFQGSDETTLTPDDRAKCTD